MLPTKVAIDCIDLTLQIFNSHLENGRVLTPEHLQTLVNSIDKITELIQAHFESEEFVEKYGKTKSFKRLEYSFYIPSKTPLILHILSASAICLLLFIIYKKYYT